MIEYISEKYWYESRINRRTEHASIDADRCTSTEKNLYLTNTICMLISNLYLWTDDTNLTRYKTQHIYCPQITEPKDSCRITHTPVLATTSQLHIDLVQLASSYNLHDTKDTHRAMIFTGTLLRGERSSRPPIEKLQLPKDRSCPTLVEVISRRRRGRGRPAGRPWPFHPDLPREPKQPSQLQLHAGRRQLANAGSIGCYVRAHGPWPRARSK